MHRYKSKRVTDFAVDKNSSHGEHFLKKKDVHYGKYSSIYLYQAVFIDLSQEFQQ